MLVTMELLSIEQSTPPPLAHAVFRRGFWVSLKIVNSKQINFNLPQIFLILADLLPTVKNNIAYKYSIIGNKLSSSYIAKSVFCILFPEKML